MTTENKPAPTTQPRKRLPWRGIGIFFSTFAVIVLLALFFLTNYYYLEVFGTKTQNSFANLHQNVNNLEQQVSQIKTDLKTQEEGITALRQVETGYNRDEWRILQAEFLTKLANDKLEFDNNVPQAILLLQKADAEIRDLSDARLMNVRKAIADDLVRLQAQPALDVPGLYLRLSALTSQINQLPLPNKPGINTEVKATIDENIPWWRRGLNQTWQVLRQIVVVRYNTKGSMPLIMPEQQSFLYQNLFAAMQQAIWGLLNHQPEIYKKSLQQASDWIKQYFVAESPATQSVLKNLNELSQVNVSPVTVRVTDSLQAFNEYSTAKQT